MCKDVHSPAIVGKCVLLILCALICLNEVLRVRLSWSSFARIVIRFLIKPKCAMRLSNDVSLSTFSLPIRVPSKCVFDFGCIASSHTKYNKTTAPKQPQPVTLLSLQNTCLYTLIAKFRANLN